MEIKIAERKLKLLLNRNYQLVSTDGGKVYNWTCSTLSSSGNCVDILRSEFGGEYPETVFVKNITHIAIHHKNKGYEPMEVDHENN